MVKEPDEAEILAIAQQAIFDRSGLELGPHTVAKIIAAVEEPIRRSEAMRMNERWRNQVLPGLTTRIQLDTERALRAMVSDLLEENAEVMADSDAQPSEWQEALGADKALRALLEKIEDWGTVR